MDISQFTVGSLDFGNARNAMRGPGFFNTDLSLTKAFKIGERLSFEVGATAFDILNHQNFDLPINSVLSSGLWADSVHDRFRTPTPTEHSSACR